ncbi:ribonuclease H-like domain-containing protein [Tanacetum coccineum]
MFNVVDISELKIIVGHPNGTLATISHVGNLKLSNNVILYDVLVVSGYCVSRLSVNKLIRDSKMFIGFDKTKCYIQDLKTEKILGTGSEYGGLYLFDMNKSNCIGQSNVDMSFHVSKLLWHNRLGHPAEQVLYVGPYKVHSKEGYKYFLTIVDDYSRAVGVYLVKTMDEVFDVFASYLKLIHNHFDVKVKIVRSDNGIKFVNKKMFDMFFDLGVENTSDVDHLHFFDTQFPQSPNNDGKDSSFKDGSFPYSDGQGSTRGRS